MRLKSLRLISLTLMSIIILTACNNSSNGISTSKTDINAEVVDSQTNDSFDDTAESQNVDSDSKLNENSQEIINDEEEKNNENVGDFYGNGNLEYISPFSQGYAWIRFTDGPNGKQYQGWIDKSGNLQYYSDYIQFSEGFSSPKFKENGKTFFSAYQEIGGGYYAVDKNGRTELIAESGTCSLCDSYIVLQKRESGFDSDKLICQVMDKDMKLIKEIEIDPESSSVNEYTGGIKTKLLGDDLLYINGSYYFGASNKWVDISLYDEYEYDSDTGHYLLDGNFGDYYDGNHLIYFVGHQEYMDYEDDQKDFIDPFLVIFDRNGERKNIDIPKEYGDNPVFVANTDKYILLSNNTDDNWGGYRTYNLDGLFMYDIENDEFKELEGKYFDRINWGIPVATATRLVPTSSVKCDNNLIAVNLNGEDGNIYTGLYNIDSMEMVCEPLKGRCVNLIDNHLLLSDGSITSLYNSKGEKISDYYGGSYNILKSEDGFLVNSGVTTENEFWLYDKNWNLILTTEKINYSTGKYLLIS